jgi:hypothetical protein
MNPSQIERPFYHFSVDDVFDSLIEISDNKLTLFEQPFFRFLKKLNTEFDARISLYLFYQKYVNGCLRTLTEVPRLEQYLRDTAPCLFFGPHALDYDTPPYAQNPQDQIKTFENTYCEIDKLAGKGAYAKFVRLHHYSESYEIAEYFRVKGVKALFSTDKEIASHRMPPHIADRLKAIGYANFQTMDFIRTHFRVELFVSENLTRKEILARLKKALDTYGFIIFYTHECNLIEEKYQGMATLIFQCLREMRVPSILSP